MPAMARILGRFLLLATLALPASLAAQTSVQPPPMPPGAQQPPVPPVAAPVFERNTGLDHVVAFSGAALALLVVCYPSRRY